MRTFQNFIRYALTPAVFAAVAALLLTTQLVASTAFVYPDGMGDYPDIQSAIDAVPDGSTIYLLPGVFSGFGNRGVTLAGKNVSILVFGTQGSAIIDCQGADRAIRFTDGVDSTSVIGGLTIRNGAASNGSGGAIDCSSAGPKIQNCTFRDNTAVYGGAIRSTGVPAPIIRGCVFMDNSAVYGGALAARDVAIRVENSTFTENSADRGGAMRFERCDPTLRNCTLCRNSASFGGAVWMEESDATIVRCIVAFNRMNEALVGEETSETSFSCVFGNADGDAIDGNAHDNSTEDPLLCDMGDGDYHLCANSYCLPSGNPWSVHIGHQAQGCVVCTSPVRETSWGLLKALYR
jgi:predicted outer membrane repeat protein